MRGNTPIVPVALAIVAAAVAVSIYLSNRPRPAPFEVESETARPGDSEETQPRESWDEIDLAATRRLSTAEGEEIVRAFHNRVRDASSVSVRVRFELSQRLMEGPIEGWVKFDSSGEFCRMEATAKQPKVKTELRREWEVMKVLGISVDPEGMRRIEYRKHSVYDMVFESTVEKMAGYIEAFRRQARTVSENPLYDLLFGIPLEDRLGELIQATAVKTSDGEEIQIVSRINRPMVEAFGKSGLRSVFPHLAHSFGEDVALRTDVYDPETGNLRRTTYSNIERKDLVVQQYTDIVLNEPIPPEWLELELPDPANFFQINRTLEDNLERGLKYDDWRAAMEEGGSALEEMRAEIQSRTPPRNRP